MGDMQIARARSRTTTESVQCPPLSVAGHRETAHANVTALCRFTVGALPFEANQDDSGFLKYSRLAARHDCGASKREKLAEIAALDA